MKSAIVLSDTHGNMAMVEKLLPLIREADYVFHLGDGAADLARYYKELQGKLFSVGGNCDVFFTGDREGVVEVEGVKVFYCHGHRYSVKRGTDELLTRAKEVGAQIALYGHTHEAWIDEADGVTMINPGALTRFTAKPSYCYLVFYGGKFTAKIVEIF